MAKTARKNRARNARRKQRKLAAEMRGDGDRRKHRDLGVLMMHLRYASTQCTEPDMKKRNNKRACRGNQWASE
jgi:hypothetical protein